MKQEEMNKEVFPIWSVKEVAQATQSKNDVQLFEEIMITGISFDSRSLEKGDLFVPLISEQNGHKYIQGAIDNGAAATLWSDPLEESPADFPVIQVEDTLKALQKFSKSYLEKINPFVIGVTGSNGKTTTKDMIEAVVSTKYKAYKTQGNFNNEIGLPVTILQMPVDTEVLVLEMGMSGSGEIHALSLLAEPDMAVITMIGESHLEYLGSREAIAHAKLEIIDGLKEDGTLVFFGDEELLSHGIEKVVGLKTKTFGNKQKNDIYPLFVETSERVTSFSTNTHPELAIHLPIPGVHNANNAMAALLVGEVLGITYEEATEALGNFKLSKNRLEWTEGIKNTLLLNDAYNASPTSMRATLEYFNELQSQDEKWIVLGQMAELGEKAVEMHLSIGEILDPNNYAQVVLYGENFKELYKKLIEISPDNVYFFEGDKEPMVKFLKEKLTPRAKVLFKSSFGTDLLSVVKELKK